MNAITPHYRTVQQLLQSQSFAIDEYQREYKWEKKNVDELISDLLDKFETSHRDGDTTAAVANYEEYFLGSIIVSKRNGKNYLIDGQQRVTSLTLLLIHLYREATKKSLPVTATIAPLIFSDNFGQPRFNLDIPERLAVIEALFHGAPFSPDGKDESVRTMYARYADIEHNELIAEFGDALPHFVYWLLTRVGLIEIATSNDNYAYAIFETMNDRGKPLSPVDMLKAYLLAPIDDAEQRRLANDNWKKEVLDLHTFGKEQEADRDATCIKAWLRAQHTETIRDRKAGATDRDWELAGTVFHRWVRDNSARLGVGSRQGNLAWVRQDFPFFAKAYKEIVAASETYTTGLESVFYNAHNEFTWQATILLAPLLPTDDTETVRKKIAATATYLDIWLMRRTVNYIRVGYSSTSYAMYLLCRDIRRKPLAELVQVLTDKLAADDVTFRGSVQKDRGGIDKLALNQFSRRYIFHLLARISISHGIRQSISNQSPEFNAWFYPTVQLVFAGNDSEGLRYGTIGTPEKLFLTWKEDEADDAENKLDKYLLKMCERRRCLELIRDFVLFDGGVKKLPRVHQHFGIKAAQERVVRREGGIIWHTQGSGKSIVMVVLARWILETNPRARVIVVTDRDELDGQIESNFASAGEPLRRTTSGADLMGLLSGAPTPRLICSLVQKFGRKDVENFDRFIRQLEANPLRPVGELFVFVDECHRTQSGKLNRIMKAMLPGAVFIGFTGTPLLKEDKQTSLEVFGSYIHTYKYSEAVADNVVLDLVYEARDVDQELGSQDKIDQWFEAKTKGLNDWQKDELRKQWGTMQRVLSSRSRMEWIVADIVFDFSVRPRLNRERGTAILVARSVYEACKYYDLFQKTVFRGRCAVITSYNPQAADVTLEDTGAASETDKQFIYNLYQAILKDVPTQPGMTKTEVYEEQAKQLFKKEPATMKLLIVVDKLLTGFDAPSCTYLYIDKSMQDHGLFQAICRTNRLDGEDKQFGYVIDYMDLFKKVQGAISVYSSELDHSAGGVDPEVILQDRLTKGRKRLEEALEAIFLICEPVPPPRDDDAFRRYFCGNTEIATDLTDREPLRASFYKACAALVRAFANIADDLDMAGFTAVDVSEIKRLIADYVKLRDMIRNAAGETLELKAYEADMRHLIDTYIEAKEPRKISPFDDMPLLDIIATLGIDKAIGTLPGGLKGNKDAVAETIENNVRAKIIKERLTDPAFYDKMSKLLDEIIVARRAKAIEYENYLKEIAKLIGTVNAGQEGDRPAEIKTEGQRALYNNLSKDADLAMRIDEKIKQVRPADWRGVQAREQEIKAAIYDIVRDEKQTEAIFAIIFHQREY